MNASLFSNIPIKKIFPLVTGCILILLSVVIALGVRQYFLYHQCNQAVAKSDKLLFEFTALQKYLSEALTSGSQVNIPRLNDEFERLNKMNAELQANPLIPAGLKNNLISRTDFISLLADLQKLPDTDAPTPQHKTELIKQINSIHNRILGFRISLSDATQIILKGLHNLIIGTLGLLFVFSLLLLFTMGRHVGRPLTRLVKSTSRSPEHKYNQNRTTLAELADTIDEVLTTQQQLSQVVDSLRKINKIPAKPGFTHAFEQHICDVLRTNPDFNFIWIGKVSEEYTLEPLSCSESAVARDIGLKAIGQMLVHCDNEENILYPAWLATQSGKPIQRHFSTPSFPTELGSFDESNHQVGTTISIPLYTNNGLWAVLSLYSPNTDPFPQQYIEYLGVSLNTIFCSAPLSEPEEDGPMVPSIDHLFQRYCYIAAGVICTETANSLTNLINGTINYTQQLIDMTAVESSDADYSTITSKIHTEEQKIRELIANMVHSTGRYHGRGLVTPLGQFCKGIATVFTKPLLSQGITLNITCENEHTIAVPPSVLWLVTLTLIQIDRAMIGFRKEEQLVKQKSITLTCKSAQEPPGASIKFSNSEGYWDVALFTNHPVWPSIEYCTQLIEQHHGQLLCLGETPGTPHTIALTFV